MRSNASAIACSLLTSAGTANEVPPPEEISLASSINLSALRATSATAYSAAKRRARVAPSPGPTPITVAIFLSVIVFPVLAECCEARRLLGGVVKARACPRLAAVGRHGLSKQGRSIDQPARRPGRGLRYSRAALHRADWSGRRKPNGLRIELVHPLSSHSTSEEWPRCARGAGNKTTGVAGCR